MAFLIQILLLSILPAQAQKVFDESQLPCVPTAKTDDCAVVIAGNRKEKWVGYIVLARRGLPGDINEFVKKPEKFSKKVEES